ncbi:MAG: serine/threonine protein kinase [Sulfuricella sp.]|nr:serine/threonine protein kinase [Sulfuricella sp.]
MEIEQIGRYQILAELGQGAMGVVYKAIDPLIDRTVAIKTINLNLSRDELAEFEERFNREAKSAGRLNHPNIVTIYDIGRADHIAFMAMEYLEGRELKEIIASGEALDFDRIAAIVAQVADGLAFAHDNGVVHRDIKPANIMVLGNGNIKITDFGIAKMSSGTRTQVGIVLGSPKYMSPEQVVGKAVDGRSDIFALGTVLYELLAGKSAFGGEDSTLATIMYRILIEKLALPSSFNPAVPGALDYIVSKALAKEPENRYQSAREMAIDLRNYRHLGHSAPMPAVAAPKSELPGRLGVIDGDATLVLASPALPRAGGVKRRVRLAATGAVALLAAAVGTWFFGPGREPTRTAQQNPVPQPAATIAVAPPLGEARPPAGAAPEPAPAPIPAKLAFAVLPWGEVYIDGKKRGPSPPLKEIDLPAGEHRIEVRNADFPPYRETVELKAGDHHKIQHKFR